MLQTSRYASSDSEEAWKTEAYKDESAQALDVIGISSFTRFDFDDNRFDSYPLIEFVKKLEEKKEKINPDIVITHDYSDLNVDHRITHQAVLTAFRPLDAERLKLLTVETLSSTEYQDPYLKDFQPNCYVKISSDYLDKKLDAMRCYKSELRDPPHPRSLEGIVTLAKKRGMEIGTEYAEAFRIVREIL